jgi:HNH endonuclease
MAEAQRSERCQWWFKSTLRYQMEVTLSTWIKGKHHTEETKSLLSAIMRGRPNLKRRTSPWRTTTDPSTLTRRQDISNYLIRTRGQRCEADCGITSEWNGKPIVLHVEHINGVGDDNREENLLLLCPNCHSQTPTYSGRNVKIRRMKGTRHTSLA